MRSIQDVCIQLFAEFIRVCDANNLRWFADSGTLLGAMRNGRMIKWDDDVDVIMPRDDYNRLCKIGPTAFSSPFFFQTPCTDYMFEIHAKLRMDGTTSLTPRERHGRHHQGMFLDIFPLDSVPDDENELNAEIGFLRMIGRYSSLHDVYTRRSMLSVSNSFMMMNNVLTDCTHRHVDSKYVGNVVFYRYSDYQYAKFNRSAYSSYILVPFSGLDTQIRVPIGWREILEVWYGKDWNIEKNIPSAHEATVDPNKSYKEYLLSDSEVI